MNFVDRFLETFAQYLVIIKIISRKVQTIGTETENKIESIIMS